MTILSRLLVPAALAASLCGAAHSETYALVVGINDYPTPVDANGAPLKDEKGEVVDQDLLGCVNDAKSISNLLVEKGYAKKDSVVTLTDSKANVTEFKKGVDFLMSQAKVGDQVVFYYSGHGSEIPAKEAGKVDQAICLADDTLVADKFFAELSKVFAQSGVNATFMFDSCYSGGMSRPPIKGRAKFVPGARLSKKAKLAPTKDLMKGAALGAKAVQAPKGEFAFIFASQEDVPSIDFPGEPAKGLEAHGLFTYVLLEVLKEAIDAPAGTLIEEISTAFDSIFKDQADIKQRPTTDFSSRVRAQKPIWLKG
jgi:hypothetical protein